MLEQIRAFARDEGGATAVEYGLIGALVSVVAIGALTAMGESLDTLFTTVSSAIDSGVSG